MGWSEKGKHIIHILIPSSLMSVNPVRKHLVVCTANTPPTLLSSPRWSRPPGAGFRLHLWDRVPHQGRERVPEPAARRPQRAAHAEKHAAGDKVSLMDRLIGLPALAVLMWCHRTCTTCHAPRCTGGNELMLCIAAYKKPRTSQFMVYEDIFFLQLTY